MHVVSATSHYDVDSSLGIKIHQTREDQGTLPQLVLAPDRHLIDKLWGIVHIRSSGPQFLSKVPTKFVHGEMGTVGGHFKLGLMTSNATCHTAATDVPQAALVQNISIPYSH
ncbi:hypothetical protein AcV5_005008 [Taiwanofungus camphoratus]|nr:hypothetical protein AcV5_005008 [Antrodia cinnamomea]